MKSEYLRGVITSASRYPGISILGTGSNLWYAGNYYLVKNKPSIKKEIVNTTNKIIQQKTELKDWEWHHVVETQHMSHIVRSDLYIEEWQNMPTILISKREHSFLSQNFNNNAFRELTTITKGRKTSNQIAPEMRRDIIRNLKMMYENAYFNYPVLNRIAKNVFQYHANFV